MRPELSDGEFIFHTLSDTKGINQEKTISYVKEAEGYSLILPKYFAASLGIHYEAVLCWITLTTHSSIHQLTAEYSKAMSYANITCYAVSSYYHDNIFVYKREIDKAMLILSQILRRLWSALICPNLD